MRFMLIRRSDAVTEAGEMPGEEVFAAMGKYNEEMAKAGVMIQGEGLHPSAKGARVKVSKNGPVVTDGPFTETKELIAGFSMIQVNSRKEAIEWAKRWPAIDTDAVIEIRQVYEMEDFGETFTPELREQEERLREQFAKKQ